jgi:hypothetical protein
MSTSTNVTAGQAVRCNLYVFKEKDLLPSFMLPILNNMFSLINLTFADSIAH